MNYTLWTIDHELLLKDIIAADHCELIDTSGKKYVSKEPGNWFAIQTLDQAGKVSQSAD